MTAPLNAIVPISPEKVDTVSNETKKEYFKRFGTPGKKYAYRDNEGHILFVAVEFSKKTVPMYVSEQGWKIGIPHNIRPINLFNSKNIKDKKNVFIVDSEKRALTKIDDWVGVTWSGGYAKTIGYSKWKDLRNIENILIWVDNIKSSNKIKSRIPHAKIISGKFDDCTDHKKLFEKKLELKDIKVCDINPVEIYKLFVHEIYGTDSLEQRNGTFWKYEESYHHWVMEDYNNIKANFQTWFMCEDNGTGSSYLDLVRSEGIAINNFMNNVIHHISMHASEMIEISQFKDSAISPYIHLENGMFYMSKKGQMAEWIDRTEKNEDFFRKKYPVHCCDFNFNKINLKDVSIEDAPCFKYVIDGFIPNSIKSTITNAEIKKTYDFFAQIVAYSISPIKPTEYFFGLYGNESTGKSFFVDLLKDIIGAKFFIERSIDDMTTNNRFASSSFWGKKVYVEPDMKTNSMLPESFIKTYAGQKQVTVEKKQKDPEDGVNISIAMFFVSNFDFITKGMEGLARRVIYIPFKNRIPRPDRTLRDKIKGTEKKRDGTQFDERPIILALAMQGWKTFLKNGSNFTMPDWIASSKSDWIEKSDTVRGFIKEKYENTWAEKPRGDLYKEYKEFCKDEMDKHPFGKSKFYEEMERMENIKSKRDAVSRRYEINPDKKVDTYDIFGKDEATN